MDDISKKSTDTLRVPRAATSAGRLNRSISDEERLQIYRQAMYQSALPELPPIPGFHTCWLTTANPRDPIESRLRMGYVLCKPEDFPELSHETLDTGKWAGYVGINEMVAAKLPFSLYQGYMVESHHAAPAREESKLAEAARIHQAQARRHRANLVIEEGLDSLDKEDVPVPDFTYAEAQRSE
jgi:hypothetical protein